MNLNCDLDCDFPELHPEEHAWIEYKMGKKLTNKEAQILLHDSTVQAAFQTWLQQKELLTKNGK